MSYEEFESWCYTNGTKREHRWENDIEYELVTMLDGWVAIFERQRNGSYVPCIQAFDMPHATNWIAMREPVTVPLNVL